MMNYSISAQGIDFIKKNEGLALVAYSDGKGINTGYSIGYGHYLTASDSTKYQNGKGAITISKDVAEQLLHSDILERVNALNGALKVNVSQTMFDALVDYGFSMSGNTLAKSDLVGLINAKANKAAIADKWLKSYVKYGSDNNYSVLVDRRRREFDLAYSKVNELQLKLGMHYTTPLESLFIALFLLLIIVSSFYYIYKKI